MYQEPVKIVNDIDLFLKIELSKTCATNLRKTSPNNHTDTDRYSLQCYKHPEVCSQLDRAKTYSGQHSGEVQAYFRYSNSAVVRRLNAKQQLKNTLPLFSIRVCF